MKTSQYWFARAEECRTKAEDMPNDIAKQSFMEVAEQYHTMALEALKKEIAAMCDADI